MPDIEVVPALSADAQGVLRDTISYRSSDNRSLLVGYLWHAPALEARGVLHIIHGMCEFIERYDDFARFLALNGYIVVGHDLLAHGDSVASGQERGQLEPGRSARILIEDEERLREAMASRYPDLPYVMLGHSMGSLILRNYLQDYVDGLSGAIFCGTTWVFSKFELKAAQVLSSVLCKLRGPQAKSLILDRLVLGAYARHFKGEGPYAWLSQDKEIQERYAQEPRNQMRFSLGAYHELFFLIARSQEERLISRMTKSLPIFIISGDKDPVGTEGKAASMLNEILLRLGFKDVRLTLYAGKRHELLNECGKEEVYQDILAWMERRYEL